MVLSKCSVVLVLMFLSKYFNCLNKQHSRFADNMYCYNISMHIQVDRVLLHRTIQNTYISLLVILMASRTLEYFIVHTPYNDIRSHLTPYLIHTRSHPCLYYRTDKLVANNYIDGAHGRLNHDYSVN